MQAKLAQVLTQENGQMAKQGLYSNINAKKKRIASGSGEKMRKPGAKGAPSAKDFKDSAKTSMMNKRKKQLR